jgi:DNA-binding NarL/FixJ family response regulator
MKIANRVLIADDHSLYRQGLSVFLKDHFSFSEIVEAASLKEAEAALFEQPRFDLALFDLLMPGMQGPMTLAPLRARLPRTKIAIVAASESKEDILEAVAAGLCGFIPKSLPHAEFVAALSLVIQGQIYVPGRMLLYDPRGPEASVALAHPPAGGQIANALASLTPRQRNVLDCIRKGMSNREIAQELGISIGTVKIHVATLLTTLHVSNRVQLALS